MPSPDAPALDKALRFVTSPADVKRFLNKDAKVASKVNPLSSRERLKLRKEIDNLTDDLLGKFGNDVPLGPDEVSSRLTSPVQRVLDDGQVIDVRLRRITKRMEHPYDSDTKLIEERDYKSLSAYRPGQDVFLGRLITLEVENWTVKGKKNGRTDIRGYQNRVATAEEVRLGLEMIQKFGQLIEAQQEPA